MITEIKIDKTTLPKNNQKIKFFVPKDGWKLGTFLAKEEMFHMENNKFHYAFEVSEWQPAKENNCKTCNGEEGYYEDVAGDGGSRMWIGCDECFIVEPILKNKKK